MPAFTESLPGDRLLDSRLFRPMLAFMLAGVLSWIVASSSFAETLIPAADAGGGGGGPVPTAAEMVRGDYSPIDVTAEIAVTEVRVELTVADMLRGAYSPIDMTSEIAVTEVEAPMTTAEMLRGDYSPIDAEPEIAVTEVALTAEEMLLGDLSPIAFDTV